MEKAEVGTLGLFLRVTSSWEKQLGREPALGRLLLLPRQPRGTVLLRSQWAHPLLQGSGGRPTCTPPLTLSTPLAHPAPNWGPLLDRKLPASRRHACLRFSALQPVPGTGRGKCDGGTRECARFLIAALRKKKR